MGPLLFLAGIFFLNFISRIILSPLMPTVEADLKIGHDEAGSFFFLISLGYCLGLLASGFVSSHLHHSKTILLSSMAAGGALIAVSISHNLWPIRLELVVLGIAGGLYLPSGIASITGLVTSKDWGKAIGIHELAPNLGFVSAPLLAEVLLRWTSWRGVLLTFGIASIITGLLFAFWGRGGAFPGEAPNSRILRSIVVEPSFWIMMALFGLAISANLGVYSMLPLYLVSEKGMDRSWANTLIGTSRILTPFMAILAGWVTDRLGVKRTLRVVLLPTALVTGMLGIVSGSWIILIVFLQPMFTTCFFPAGFAALSRMGSSGAKNLAISLTVPISFLFGGGAVPAGLGLLGEMGSFCPGFIILGGLFLVGVVLTQYLKFPDERPERAPQAPAL